MVQQYVKDAALQQMMAQSLADKIDAVGYRFKSRQIDESTARMELAQLGYSGEYQDNKLRAWRSNG